MSFAVLIALLIAVGPFVVPLALAAIAWLEFSPRPARVRPVRFRLPTIQLAVA
jgi:hypothetical protein